MKKISYVIFLVLFLVCFSACGKKDVNSGNFSSEMIIEGGSDVTIVEMP